MTDAQAPRYRIRYREPTDTHRDRSRRALHKAAVLAGSQEELMFALGLAPSNYTRWKRVGEVPPQHALAIEEYTGGLVRAGLLCPMLDASLRPSRVRISKKAARPRRNEPKIPA